MKVKLQDLPDSILIRIWEHVPLERGEEVANRHALPLVCRRWWQLSKTKEAAVLWKTVTVKLHLICPELASDVQRAESSLFDWFSTHGAATESLIVQLYHRERWNAFYALLGMRGRQLTSLRLSCGCYFHDEERAVLSGWLSLVPNLKLLEIDDIADDSLVVADFPKHLTNLVLDFDEEIECKMPTGLTKLSCLRHLGVRGLRTGELSNEWMLPALENLELSFVNLESVPRELTKLTSLSSLTLNGGKFDRNAACAVLAELSALERLEMRGCRLSAIPTAVTGLLSLKTLLLGYNNFTAECVVPPGPYLSSLELLAMSDSMREPVSFINKIVIPLAPATALQVLRINRNWGLTVTTVSVAALLHGKSQFKSFEYSEEMAEDLDLDMLRSSNKSVVFKAVD